MKKSTKRLRDIEEKVGPVIVILLPILSAQLIAVLYGFSRVAPEWLPFTVTITILYFIVVIALCVLFSITS